MKTKKKKFVIIDKEHPWYGSAGVLLDEKYTLVGWRIRMGLDNEIECMVKLNQVRKI